MKMKLNLSVFSLFCLFSLFNIDVQAKEKQMDITKEKEEVIARVKKAKAYIEKKGKEKAIIKFRKHAHDIVIGDYKGIFFVSPLHPDQIGKNNFNYRDPSGVLVVQEEINKAKAGGGWLKGRWRENPKTGKYQCRKIYILPMPGNYFIGSWYHYSSDKPGICLI